MGDWHFRKEEELPYKIKNLLTEYNPTIVVVTGHDAYYNQKKEKHTRIVLISLIQLKKLEGMKKP